MATYTPVALIPFSSFSTAGVYTASSAATTGIIRTITFDTTSAAQTVTVTLQGADAAATRLLDAYALTASVPAIFNGWWVQPVTAVSLIGVKTNAAALSVVTGTVGGYAYT
jgi:hypothetical protein